MRVKNKALLITLLIVSAPASAFEYCSEPIEPTIPRGYIADEYQMEKAKREIQRYLKELQSYANCLERNISATTFAADDVVDRWRRAVDAYNSN